MKRMMMTRAMMLVKVNVGMMITSVMARQILGIQNV